MTESMTNDLRATVKRVAVFNFGYFWVEFAVAIAIGSVALFADSVDFLEDASVNFLIAAALGWPARKRARVGMVLALLILVPALFALWTAWEKFNVPTPPEPLPLTITGLGALAVNFACAYMLVRFRNMAGSLTKAAFLSARNDAYGNVAIILAGLATLWTTSAWPDLAVGLGIALMNAGAAFEVWEAARKESLEQDGD
ncbi:MAG: cation transporter [Proteobacteria bacterium]|nr:cation transporter [Pseudomonadota bacterium]